MKKIIQSVVPTEDEAKLILAYRSLADECRELLFDLALSTAKRTSNLRHSSPVLLLVVGGAS